MSRRAQTRIGTGLARIAHEGMREIRRKQRAARARSAPAKLPESLRVYTRFQHLRWHALCGAVTVNDYGSRLTAAYAAAQEAWGRLLGHGVLLRRVALERMSDPDVFIARLREEEGVSA